MGLKIIFRKRKEYSPFRHALLKIVGLPQTDSLVLCSGYIYENENGYRVSQDQLANALSKGCQNGIITVVAGKLNNDWRDHYKRFLISLSCAGLKIRAFIVPKKNWHAKIAIKLKNDEPVVAIIGSSNLTRPAYGENCFFNYECDVIIWQKEITNLIVQQFSEIESDKAFDRWEVIDAVLNTEKMQPDEKERLKKLYSEIKEIINIAEPYGEWQQ